MPHALGLSVNKKLDIMLFWVIFMSYSPSAFPTEWIKSIVAMGVHVLTHKGHSQAQQTLSDRSPVIEWKKFLWMIKNCIDATTAADTMRSDCLCGWQHIKEEARACGCYVREHAANCASNQVWDLFCYEKGKNVWVHCQILFIIVWDIADYIIVAIVHLPVRNKGKCSFWVFHFGSFFPQCIILALFFSDPSAGHDPEKMSATLEK